MTPAPGPIDRGAVLLGLIVIVLANVRYLSGLASILDPAPSMEPFHIDMARRPIVEILAHDPTWGTLYALWLRPLRLLLDDPLRVYAANVYVLSFGLSLAVYSYTLLVTRRAAVAAGTALFFLVSDLNVPLSSKVCAFSLVVVLVGLTLSQLASRLDRRMAIAAGSILLAAYARPELYPAGLCVWIAAVWMARRHVLDKERSTLAWVVGGTGLILAVAWWIGTPVWSAHHQDARLFDAFREHFAWNWMRWTGRSAYYLTIWRREFGAADGILAACLDNPAAVAHHVGANLAGIAQALLRGTFEHYPLLAAPAWPAMVTLETLAVSVASLGCVAAVLVRREWREVALQRYRHVYALFLAMTLFPIAGAAVVYPIMHYLILPAACLLLTAAFSMAIVMPDPSVASPLRRGMIAVLCLAAIPTPFVLPTQYFAPKKAPIANLGLRRDVTDAVQLIRALDLPKPARVLTFNDGIGELLGAGFDEVKIWRRGEKPLKTYLEDEHIDVIVTLEPGRQSFVVDDPYWETIQLDPASTGFASVATPHAAAARIWIRADLLRPPTPQG
jgi:hypothetical protein